MAARPSCWKQPLAAFAAGPAPLGLHVQVLPTPLEMQRVLGTLAEALAAGLNAAGRLYRVGVPANKRHVRDTPMTTVLLSLGSNLRPHHYLPLALDVLQERFGRIVASPAYRTRRTGRRPRFTSTTLVMLETDLPLAELDDWLHAVEDAHGRDRSGPRVFPTARWTSTWCITATWWWKDRVTCASHALS